MIRELHPSIHDLIAPDAAIEKLAGDFLFTEGPIWFRAGYLIFSDIPANTMYKWDPVAGISVFRKPSGFDGPDWPAGAFIGANGLTLNPEGRLIICEHGNRRVTRLENDGSLTVLASHDGTRRLNSPNDVVFKSDGAMYFTDPPYGFVAQDQDPAKELDYNGVYRLKDGVLTLLHKGMTRPNGLAFTPDEQFLYVGNSDSKKKIWNRFPVLEDGTLGEPVLFADLTSITDPGLPDGMKIDTAGNLYCTGPGGVHVFHPDGTRLGVIVFPEIPANLHWGDADGQTLYVTARTGLYRVRTKAKGIRPAAC
ncbi:MAG: SMP-30/gluconolactonase/LRE family protein [Bryobacteraceae bacterium]